MWSTILQVALKFVFGKLYSMYVGPWIKRLKEDKQYQRAIEIAGPLIEMAERGELAELLSDIVDKKEAVLMNMKEQLKREGIELATYLLNSALEVAVTAMTEAGVINKGGD